jgi:DNA-binding beta-propeller fold protein YncE
MVAAAGLGPVSIAIDPAVKVACTANRSSNGVSAYSIGSNDLLPAISDSPFRAGLGPLSVAVDPMAKFVFVANIESGDISAYSIGPPTEP